MTKLLLDKFAYHLWLAHFHLVHDELIQKIGSRFRCVERAMRVDKSSIVTQERHYANT